MKRKHLSAILSDPNALNTRGEPRPVTATIRLDLEEGAAIPKAGAQFEWHPGGGKSLMTGHIVSVQVDVTLVVTDLMYGKAANGSAYS